MPKKSLYEDHIQPGTRGYYTPNPDLGIFIINPSEGFPALPARQGYTWLCHSESEPTRPIRIQIRHFIPEIFFAEYLANS